MPASATCTGGAGAQGLLNLGVGASSYAVTQNWRVRMQYVNYDTLKWKGDNQASVKSQTLSVGVDYMFR